MICFNFRTDRCREITRALTQEDLNDYGMQRLKLHYTTLTNYDQTFTDINVIFNKENLQNTLGEVLANNKKTQIRIAETEKYPHVTFFFQEEERLSLKAKTTDGSFAKSTYLRPTT